MPLSQQCCPFRLLPLEEDGTPTKKITSVRRRADEGSSCIFGVAFPLDISQLLEAGDGLCRSLPRDAEAAGEFRHRNDIAAERLKRERVSRPAVEVAMIVQILMKFIDDISERADQKER